MPRHQIKHHDKALNNRLTTDISKNQSSFCIKLPDTESGPVSL